MARFYSMAVVALSVLLTTNLQFSCGSSSQSRPVAPIPAEVQITDEDLLKQVEAFSTDPPASDNAWKTLQGMDRPLLIERLKKLSLETSEDDFRRVLISFLLCHLNYEYEVNRAVVLSSLQKQERLKDSNGDWAASLVRKLMVKGDQSLLPYLLRAATWSDGAMSMELAQGYSEALRAHPEIFLKDLEEQNPQIRAGVLQLLPEHTLSDEELAKVNSFLSERCKVKHQRLACDTFRALSKKESVNPIQ